MHTHTFSHNIVLFQIDPFTGQPLQQPPPVAQPQAPQPQFPVYAQVHGQAQPRAQPTPPPATSAAQGTASPWTGGGIPEPAKNDPFDAAWMARKPNRPTDGATNPFQQQQSQQPPAEPAFTVNM